MVFLYCVLYSAGLVLVKSVLIRTEMEPMGSVIAERLQNFQDRKDNHQT